MLIASIPTKIDIIFGASASGTYIRAIPDTTIDPNAASFTFGFPPNTFVDPGAGGEPPDGRDVNGILNMLSAWTRWLNAGAPVFYDAAFSSSIGGYPQYAMLANASMPGEFWISTVDNNTSDPDTGGANWSAFPPSIGSYVSSFNTRTGAVVLSSADVVNALAANALPLAKIAIAPAFTILANPAGSPATAAWTQVAGILGLLGLTGVIGTNSYVTIPINVSGALINLYVQFGFVSNGGGDNVVTVTFPVSFPTKCLWASATTVSGGVLVADGGAYVVQNPGQSSMQVGNAFSVLQPGDVITGEFWIAIGY